VFTLRMLLLLWVGGWVGIEEWVQHFWLLCPPSMDSVRANLGDDAHQVYLDKIATDGGVSYVVIVGIYNSSYSHGWRGLSHACHGATPVI
jgi:hypothetical protein